MGFEDRGMRTHNAQAGAAVGADELGAAGLGAGVLGPAELAWVFEHSITWEGDIWKADPCDVTEVHANARRKFVDLLDAVTSGKKAQAQARILLFHGQSGAGKTHLIRALRTHAHGLERGYFGYAQMTPDVGNYADYFLRRLINSLEKPFDPVAGGETALMRLSRRLVMESEIVSIGDRIQLGEDDLTADALARLVSRIADEIVASPRFRSQDLDINIVRALLYLQRNDPRIDQRVRHYLNGKQLNELSHASVAALDPNEGEDRAFEIIESLGKLIWTIDAAALVFCIDQVEDLRHFDNAAKRFDRAIRDLIQIANRVNSAIILISCLDEFYDAVRPELTQSYRDRIEKSVPVQLGEARNAVEARRILDQRLGQAALQQDEGVIVPDAASLLGDGFCEAVAGLSTRRVVEHAKVRCDQLAGGAAIDDFDVAFGASHALSAGDDDPRLALKEHWERFCKTFEADIPADEHELLLALIKALELAREEIGGQVQLSIETLQQGDDLAAADVMVRHPHGLNFETRLFVCNKGSQGGGLKRQIDKVLAHMRGKPSLILRASDFPPNTRSVTGQAFRQFQGQGGRRLVIPLYEWERMIAAIEFRADHRNNPGFAGWLEAARPLSDLPSVAQLLRLDLLGGRAQAEQGGAGAVAFDAGADQMGTVDTAPSPMPDADPAPADTRSVDEIEEGADPATRLAIGRTLDGASKSVALSKAVLKRHAAVLGGSGSGKTTLALCLIEQLLARGTPVVLIDRKGDLCSYANPDSHHPIEGEPAERQWERDSLFEAIDVAVFTPGRTSGRPISITLLPNGISELPEHEQQLLANLSAAALGDMLHLRNSATHQKQSGILSVALRLLGATSRSQVMLSDLIHLLEAEDPALIDLTQRMDPSGKIRRDLVAQLDSLLHRNSALFAGAGEPLSMESLLGLGKYGTTGKTRLSVIYTGFLGDNENILFWVSQFLSEALRFCQRNPNDELQAVIMFDEADLYIPANSKPATAEPLQSLLKRARSAGVGLMLATQSPGDLDYKSRDQITSWFIGRVREDTALRKLKAAFQTESGLDPAVVLPHQTVGEFHLIQEGKVQALKSHRSLISAEQVPFDRIEQLARETRRNDGTAKQLGLFDRR